MESGIFDDVACEIYHRWTPRTLLSQPGLPLHELCLLTKRFAGSSQACSVVSHIAINNQYE